MTAIGEAFQRLRSGAIESGAFERCLLESVLYFPCWDSAEEPARGWRRTEDSDTFNPLIATREGIPVLPIFDDPNQIAPWLARRGDSSLANQLSFVTMHGRALLNSVADPVHVMIVLSDGSMIEFDRQQLDRLRNA